MTPIIVCGAAGRMGRTLVSLIGQHSETELVGALEVVGHPDIGRDAGELAGAGTLHVKIGDSPLLEKIIRLRPGTVTLDFTNPASAITHLRVAVKYRAPIVIGTTGYSAEQQAKLDMLAPQTCSVVASNMSVGIAVLLRLVREAALALGPEFDPEIVEMHHKMKIDAPSGTALTLAQTIADVTGRALATNAVYSREGIAGTRPPKEIGILALRGGDVVGDHTVIFAGMGERLELTHRTQSRDALARGALRAALWLPQQPIGRYAMADVLGMK